MCLVLSNREEKLVPTPPKACTPVRETDRKEVKERKEVVIRAVRVVTVETGIGRVHCL